MAEVYLGLGTNLGKRRQNLEEALQRLTPLVTLTAVSPLYETAPAYVLDQPPFLNIAVAGKTRLAPLPLLQAIKQLEAAVGRTKTIRYGPRQIDLDILFYDDLVLKVEGLQIPHPRLPERGFVLRPLAAIAPRLRHPILGKTVWQLLDELPEDGILQEMTWPHQTTPAR